MNIYSANLRYLVFFTIHKSYLSSLQIKYVSDFFIFPDKKGTKKKKKKSLRGADDSCPAEEVQPSDAPSLVLALARNQPQLNQSY